MRVPRSAPPRFATLAGVLLALLAVTPPRTPLAATPPLSRKSATIEALLAYPAFFHMQGVRVRGEVRDRDGELALAGQARELLLVMAPGTTRTAAPGARAEVTGTFLDLGRLEPGDPRLRGLDAARWSEARLGKPWPGIGELPLLLADDVQDAPPYPTPSPRALALEPERFLDQVVTVTGRFRGRNLFGDQPNAPGRSRWDFVIASADASVWVAGLRPRGQGFTLDLDSRADGARWVEVTGTVREARGLVYLDATAVRLARSPSEAPAEPVVRVPAMGPPPEILFSTPTNGETDVSPAVAVRVQFSRDIAVETLKGRIVARYEPDGTGAGGEAPTPLAFSTAYQEEHRALELRFTQSLAAARTVVIEFLEGIESTDGAVMAPAALRFTVGG